MLFSVLQTRICFSLLKFQGRKMIHIHPTSFPLWPYPALLYLSIILICQRVPICVCADDSRFLNCSSTIQCGDLQNISYPFWGLKRASYCGRGNEFELTCENDIALLTMGDLEYRLLGYSGSTKNFTVARNDYRGTLCSSTFQNSSQDPSPFAYTLDTLANNLTIYFHCPYGFPSVIPSTSMFICLNDTTEDSPGFAGYFVNRNVRGVSDLGTDSFAKMMLYFGTCATNVVVPAYASAIHAIESNPSNNTLLAALQQGFGLRWTDANDLCAICVRSGGQCGRDEDLGGFACYCSGGFTTSTCSSGSGSELRKWLTISTVCATTAVIATILTIWLHRRQRSSYLVDNYNNVEMAINTHGFLGPRRYRYFELKKITNSFAEKIGQGGYGTVYKGKLPDGQLVAVKLLIEFKAHGEEFINEVVSISRTSHVNVVSLLGFCYERSKRALIYEFLSNGSLDKFIPLEGALNTSLKIDWKIVHQIILGIAQGLEYLHRGCKTRILHFDIKPQNILLGKDFIPKISDFGLAKLCLGNESMVSLLGTRGTIGYIAPEVISRNFGRVSHKSDVYSYGMLVLAIVCGKSINNEQVSSSSDLYFPHNIYKQLVPGRDFKFEGIMTNEEEEIARKLILVSLWCIQTNPCSRPSITEVIEMLEGSLHSINVPPEPFLTDPLSQHQNLVMAPHSNSYNKNGDEEESIFIGR